MTRRSSRRRACLAGLVGSLVALGASNAVADVSRAACIDSNAKAQDLRREHKLALARVELNQCVDPSCPHLVREDCISQLADLERAQPTVVFDVVDAAGAFVPGVKITTDGSPHPELSRPTSGSGGALALDPGSHAVTFEAPGFVPLARSVEMIEGDRGHHERIVLAPSSRPRAPVPVETSIWNGWQPRASLAAASLGIAGIVTGSIFGALTFSEKSSQESACPASCSANAHAQAESDHAAGSTDGAASTVAFIAGGVLVATGVTLWITRPMAGSAPLATLTVTPTVTPGLAAMLVSARF